MYNMSLIKDIAYFVHKLCTTMCMYALTFDVEVCLCKLKIDFPGNIIFQLYA